MNLFQFIATVILVGLVAYAIYRFITRNKNKKCARCLDREQQSVNWGPIQTDDDVVIEEDTSDESDLSEDEQEEEQGGK